MGYLKPLRIPKIAFFLLVLCQPAGAANYFVATSGNDTWTGDARRPFATLQRALMSLRNVRGPDPGKRAPATILMGGGEYFIPGGVVLDGGDSDLTIQANPGERALLFGGRPVTGWRKESKGWWSAPVEGLPLLHLLVVDGYPRPRARLPRGGGYEHETVFSNPWMSTTGGGWKDKPTLQQLNTMRYKKGDLGPWLDVGNAEVRVYHMWDEALVPLVAHNPLKRELTFGLPCEHPPGAFDVRRYAVFNVKEGMLEPGNWYHDRVKGRLYYWPKEGETMEGVRALVPTAESVLRLDGRKERPVSRVTLRGLRISLTNTPLGIGTYGAARYPGAVEIQYAEGCVLEDLEFFHVAGQGLRASFLDASIVRKCHFMMTGACGLRVEGRSVTISDNRVTQPGRVYPGAIGIWVAGGERNVVSHNEVRLGPYGGIVVSSNATRVTGNLIERVMLELHDGAGFYTGFCRGVTVRGNVIRNIEDTGGYGSSAYYIDETGEDDLVEGNLSLNVVRPCHNHMARNNVIRRNLFVSSGRMTVDLQRCAGFKFEDNILAAQEDILISAPPEGFLSFKGNLLSPGAGKVLRESLDRYNPTGRTEFLPDDGNAVLKAGVEVLADQTVQFATGSPGSRKGIDPAVFKKAGCSW